ncbi:hypothetical protein [Aeromicrobium sp. UC242_57]|uniref:hypothetical protein n=1 Tax=Aeromicrobium sp. UC242_57 TaxID=3374624 RepID=UPI0037C06AF9
MSAEIRKAERLAWRERLKEDFASILERGIHTVESSEDGGPLGNAAWCDHIHDTIRAATGKPIPWLAIELAILLDRMVREAELLESPND